MIRFAHAEQTAVQSQDFSVSVFRRSENDQRMVKSDRVKKIKLFSIFYHRNGIRKRTRKRVIAVVGKVTSG